MKTITIATQNKQSLKAMLSRRDKLLIKPWEQRRYENHLRKVQTALPVIDNKPPVSREHVAVKLKKRQKEVERVHKIEYENLILLRKMNYIMKTSRVDNYWSKPLPNFLNKVSLYETEKRPSINYQDLVENIEVVCKKSAKCKACNPEVPHKNIPEERVPWEPPKMFIPRERRSKSVPVRKNSLPTITESHSSTKSADSKPKSSDSRKSRPIDKNQVLKKHKSFEDCCPNPQRLILTRGALKLCVNFPSDTQIKLHDGPREMTLTKGLYCGCKKATKN